MNHKERKAAPKSSTPSALCTFVSFVVSAFGFLFVNCLINWKAGPRKLNLC
jgi:hypothetical protein